MKVLSARYLPEGQCFLCLHVGALIRFWEFMVKPEAEFQSDILISFSSFPSSYLASSPRPHPLPFSQIPELLPEDRTHGEMIPHEEPGSPAEIKCDFPCIRLKPEPARQ